MAYDVFVSYSHQDKLTADAVCATLEAQGIRCWIAPRDINPGQEWGQAIIQAIGGARVMVVVFSHHSNHSPQVMREVERAVHAGLAVLPFRIEDVAPSGSLEYFLSSMHWLDALSEDREVHIQRLATSIRAILDGDAEAPGGGRQVTGAGPAPQPAAPPARRRSGLVAGVVGAIAAVAILLFYLGLRGSRDGEEANLDAGRSGPVAGESGAPAPAGPGEMSGPDSTSSDMVTAGAPTAGQMADAKERATEPDAGTSPPAPIPAPAESQVPVAPPAATPMARATPPEPAPPATTFVPPPDNSFMAETPAGYEYAYVIQAAVESELAGQAFALVDPASSPQRDIRELVRFGVATTARVVDTRELKFYGRTQTQYTVTLTLQVTDLTRGAIVVGPINTTVQYTSVNAEQNLQQAARELASRAAAEMRQRIAGAPAHQPASIPG